MSFKLVYACDNCHKVIPEHCNGRVYRCEDMSRDICAGLDGDQMTETPDGTFYKYIRGHGQSWLVPLTQVR